MSKYPWDKAPEWAKFAATDGNGVSYWHERRPVWDCEWRDWDQPFGGRVAEIKKTHPSESLEQRP